MLNMNEEKTTGELKSDWMKLDMTFRHQNCVAVILVLPR
jgi:hypothetical protein